MTPDLPKLLAPLNSLLQPLIQAGLGNPLLFTPGVTVLDVPGRKTGIRRSTPLTCCLAGRVMLIGTVRANSQWIRNLAASDSARVWLWGRARRVRKLHITDQLALLELK